MKKKLTEKIRVSTHHSSIRLIIAAIVGIIIGIVVGSLGAWKFAPLAGWASAIALYVIWVLATVLPMNASSTKSHAVREDPGRASTDVLLLVASIASIAGVVMLLVQASGDNGLTKVCDIILGLGSIVISWFLVHVTYLLKYARLYYGNRHTTIDFNEKDAPQYTDFAYLAFTLGMTFQVSDTDLKTKEIRAMALRHALLSYLFGTVIIATTINTLASLSH
ncbi:MAG: DUF1345 domain-containing protein [Candidatus Saccharimonadales bacterium]